MHKQYEYTNHTADIGITAYGKSLEEVFSNAAQALIAYQIEGIVEKISERQIAVSGTDHETLLVNFLSEILFFMNTEKFIIEGVRINSITHNSLHTHLFGEAYDPSRHSFTREIKAITYHQLSVEQIGDLFKAHFICDI